MKLPERNGSCCGLVGVGMALSVLPEPFQSPSKALPEPFQSPLPLSVDLVTHPGRAARSSRIPLDAAGRAGMLLCL